MTSDRRRQRPAALLYPLITTLLTAVLAGWPLQAGWAQEQRAFVILKTLEQQKLEESLELVRDAQRCVNAARNLRALHDCHRQERDREWEQRERFHRQIEAVRARYGLRRPGERPRERPGDRPPPPPPRW